MLIAMLLAAAAPQPGQLQTFEDWIVGCDNVRACQAVALLPDGTPEGYIAMSLRREPGGDPLISFSDPEARGGALVAGGRRLPARLLTTGHDVVVHPSDAAAVVEAFGAAELELVDAGGARIGLISLAGARAAMAYLDAAQRGPVPALPEVRLAPRPEETPPEFGADRIRTVRDQVGCAIGEVGGPDEFSAVQLAPGTTLVLLACGTGAYNLGIVPLIARTGGNAIAPAPFDLVSAADDGKPFLVNASWDYDRRLIVTDSRGRGIGDCGVRAQYGWDGERFRLVRRDEMGECRFAFDYITTWRARVVRPRE